VEKGATPIWRKTGVLSGVKGSRKYNQNKKQAENMIPLIIEQYQREISPVAGFQLVQPPEREHTPTLSEAARAYRLKRPKIGQDILFEQAVDLYLRSATSLKGNTLDKYKHAAAHIKSWFGMRQLYVSEINSLDVTEYFRHKSLGLNDDGSEPTDEKAKKKQTLGKTTLKDHKIVLNQTWQFCTEALKIVDVSNNPMLAVKIGRTQLHSNYLRADQVIKFLTALMDDDTRLEIIAAIVLALFYGLRRQEVLGMSWSALDTKADTLLVCRTATVVGNTIIYEDTTKTKASYRTMPLFPFVKKVLMKLYNRQMQMKRMLGSAYHKNDYIIKWDDGHLLRPDYLTAHFADIMAEYSEKLGIEKITFHQLRHSAASLLAANGHSAHEIALWLGQASAKSAERYIHLQVQETKHRLSGTIDSALVMPNIAI
jgi:integrase